MNFYERLADVIQRHGSVDIIDQGIRAEGGVIIAGKAPVRVQKVIAKTHGNALTHSHTNFRRTLEELTGHAYRGIPSAVNPLGEWTRYGLGVNFTHKGQIYSINLTVPIGKTSVVVHEEPCVNGLRVPVQAVHRALKNQEYVLLLKAANALRERRNYSVST